MIRGRGGRLTAQRSKPSDTITSAKNVEELVYETLPEIGHLNIPREIPEFFQDKQSQSLLVKGGTGTGKTTFALEVLKELSQDQPGVCVFTRVEKDEIFRNFPWVQHAIQNGRFTIFDRNDGIADPNKFLVTVKQMARERPYSVFIIDTLDAIIEQYESQNRRLKAMMNTLKSERINAVLVQEEETGGFLDYLVGGIVQLTQSETDGRRIREILLHKLRGVEIRQPRYLVSLSDGKFKSFEPFNPSQSSINNWQTVPDLPTHFSTGTPDLDQLLSGGFKKGSYNVIEIADNVSISEYMSVIRPMLLNFLNQSRGVVAVLTGGEHPEMLRSDLLQFIPHEQFDHYMRIADYFTPTSNKSYVMALGTKREDAIRRWTQTITHLRGGEGKPILEFNGFDTIEYLRGDEIAIKELLNGVARTKVSNDLGLGVIKPGLKITQAIKNMADTYLKIVDIDKTCCIYGLKPQAGLYAITPDEMKGYPNIRLTPVV